MMYIQYLKSICPKTTGVQIQSCRESDILGIKSKFEHSKFHKSKFENCKLHKSTLEKNERINHIIGKVLLALI